MVLNHVAFVTKSLAVSVIVSGVGGFALLKNLQSYSPKCKRKGQYPQHNGRNNIAQEADSASN